MSKRTFADFAGVPNAFHVSRNVPRSWKRRRLPEVPKPLGSFRSVKSDKKKESPSSFSNPLSRPPQLKDEPWNFFYLDTHGGFRQSFGVLNREQRHRIPILALGSQGEASYSTVTLLFFTYMVQKWGNRFLDVFLDILQRRGAQYLREVEVMEVSPHLDLMEQELLYLLQLNRIDRWKYPQHVFRLYYHNETIQDIYLDSKNESVTMYVNLLKPLPTTPPVFETTIMKNAYSHFFEWPDLKKIMLLLEEVVSSPVLSVSSPIKKIEMKKTGNDLWMSTALGLYTLHKKTLKRIPPATIPVDGVYLHQVLASLKKEYPTSKNLLFMHCCRGENKNLRVQKVNQQDILDMMSRAHIRLPHEDPQRTKLKPTLVQNLKDLWTDIRKGKLGASKKQRLEEYYHRLKQRYGVNVTFTLEEFLQNPQRW